jgi:hypothetical protein
MKKEEIDKLLNLLDDETTVLYNASPYVAEIGSGDIYENDSGEMVYEDSAVCDIKLSEEYADNFTVYRKIENWLDN